MKLKFAPLLTAGFVFGILVFSGSSAIPITLKCFKAIWAVSKALFKLAEEEEHQDQFQQSRKSLFNTLRNIQLIVEKDEPNLNYGIQALSINIDAIFDKPLDEIHLGDIQNVVKNTMILVQKSRDACLRNQLLSKEVEVLRVNMKSFIDLFNEVEKAKNIHEPSIWEAMFDLGKALMGLENLFQEIITIHFEDEGVISDKTDSVQNTDQDTPPLAETDEINRLTLSDVALTLVEVLAEADEPSTLPTVSDIDSIRSELLAKLLAELKCCGEQLDSPTVPVRPNSVPDQPNSSKYGINQSQSRRVQKQGVGQQRQERW